ncbi:hypothetical protein D3C72_2553500 [compost metagenome]
MMKMAVATTSKIRAACRPYPPGDPASKPFWPRLAKPVLAIRPRMAAPMTAPMNWAIQ